MKTTLFEAIAASLLDRIEDATTQLEGAVTFLNAKPDDPLLPFPNLQLVADSLRDVARIIREVDPPPASAPINQAQAELMARLFDPARMPAAEKEDGGLVWHPDFDLVVSDEVEQMEDLVRRECAILNSFDAIGLELLSVTSKDWPAGGDPDDISWFEPKSPGEGCRLVCIDFAICGDARARFTRPKTGITTLLPTPDFDSADRETLIAWVNDQFSSRVQLTDMETDPIDKVRTTAKAVYEKRENIRAAARDVGIANLLDDHYREIMSTSLIEHYEGNNTCPVHGIQHHPASETKH